MFDAKNIGPVLVTGGGSGIGRASAKRLAPYGPLIIADVIKSAAEDTAGFLRDAGYNAYAVQVDVSDGDAVAVMYQDAISNYGKLSGIVHCAGISERKQLCDINSSDWDRMIRVNLTGSFWMAKYGEAALQDGSAVVIVSSGSALTGSGGGVHYASSKAAQLGMVRALAREWAPRRIRVNAVCPRSIETPMLDILYNEDKAREVVATIPLGRLGTVYDVASLIHYLITDNGFMTGQWLLMDGGRMYSS